MKIVIDESLKGKELYQFLIENKSQLIAQKKSMPVTSDGIKGNPCYFNIKESGITKTAVGNIAPDVTSVRAKIVANTAYWMDSQMDVLLPDCWEKSIQDGKGRIHLKDHTYKMDAEVGDVVNIYSQQMSLAEFGINKAGTTQSLIYESDVKKSYDEKTFDKYRSGKVNQHSIGLQYVKLNLAIDDADYKEEFALWNKTIGNVINQDDATNAGFFFVVAEIKLIEVSAVILGANELTPTLEVKSNTEDQPSHDTDPQPLPVVPFNWRKAIHETKFVTI